LRDEIQSSNCGESDAIKHDAFTTMDQRDVTPRLHPSRDGLGGFGIVGTKEIERLVRKDDTESPCGALGILLKNVDLVFRMPTLPEIAEVQPTRAAPQHSDAIQPHDVFLPFVDFPIMQ
jgi:hypothetical protein